MARRKKSDGIALGKEQEHQVRDWLALDDREFAEVVIQGCLSTAGSGREKREKMALLYAVFEERFSPAEREAVEKKVVQSILRGAPAGALMPFIVMDPALSVVSTAALDFAVLRQLSEEHGPFTGPKVLLSNLTPDVGLSETSRTGILMGLVLLGDRRLLPFLDGCWQLLGPEGRDSLARATSGCVTAALIDFFLMWLEQTDDQSNFGGIVGTLCRAPSISASGMVMDIERAFPVGSPEYPESPIRVLGTWTFPEYYKKIQGRLKKIEKQESEPKLIPNIARFWNGI